MPKEKPSIEELESAASSITHIRKAMKRLKASGLFNKVVSAKMYGIIDDLKKWEKAINEQVEQRAESDVT